MMETESSAASARKADAAPVLPPGAADMDVLALLTKVEEHAGRSKAEARLGAMHVLAERDAAMAGTLGRAATPAAGRLRATH